MKYKCAVKYNGVYYAPGTEVPTESAKTPVEKASEPVKVTNTQTAPKTRKAKN